MAVSAFTVSVFSFLIQASVVSSAWFQNEVALALHGGIVDISGVTILSRNDVVLALFGDQTAQAGSFSFSYLLSNQGNDNLGFKMMAKVIVLKSLETYNILLPLFVPLLNEMDFHKRAAESMLSQPFHFHT